MNEIDLVRDLLDPPPPPSGAVRSRALARLEEDMSGGRPRRLAFGPRFRLGLAGLVAAGAAAAVGVAALGDGAPAAPPRPQAVEMDARTVLLAAARQAEKEPTGRYWRVQTVDGSAYHVGPADGGYTVLGYSSHTDRWQARSDADRDVTYVRDLGARPLGPRDEAAWRKAGGPKTFKVVSGGEPSVLSTVPGRTTGAAPASWTPEIVVTPAQKRTRNARWARICAGPDERAKRLLVFKGGCREVPSDAELRKVAGDPGKLRRALSPWLEPDGVPRERDTSALRLRRAARLLTSEALSPKVRAGVFRLLADEPGVRSIGRVRDPRGREGVALVARGAPAEDGSVDDHQLILEPGTHRILAGVDVVVRPGEADRGMRPGTLHGQRVVLSLGWTNETPHHP
ncbi:hypothetical protein GCM10009678_56980 [Actinomadura kijaniata]|uniref:CU044_5270 family protein n=1 Tax=Actinomadura namibiensis TaxID=182080 RepID=A0A7W3LL33_ACTNM|nr:CU044_5270 family protein [Actinomadura namibiensis]MBA8950133.1 hypothetical protein [Actinomadura namibiensis]